MIGPGRRPGVLLAVVSYAIWGLFPLYWPLLAPAGSLEILAHRILWSFVFTAILLAFLRQWRQVRHLGAKTWGLMSAAAVAIAINWGTYIYAVNNGHVIEAALGYFINPLLSAGVGVLIFKEKLRPLQWTALGIATGAVLVISVGTGRIPWLALTMAVSFGLYGVIKKIVPLAPTISLPVESLLLLPLSLGFLIVLQANGTGTFIGFGAGHIALLVGSGLLTAIPLLAFGSAAQRLPLNLMGFLQYITPTFQFLLGVFWAHEVMPPSRWIGFSAIWFALALYTFDAMRVRRSRARIS